MENAWDSDDEKYTWKESQFKIVQAPIDSVFQDPWKVEQELTPAQTPEPTNLSYQYNPNSSSNVSFFQEEEPEISPVEAIKKELLLHNDHSPRNSQEEEKLYSLDATADDKELILKVMGLQEKLKGEMVKVFKSQEGHKRQVEENKMLKEYVQNLMKSSSTQGTDRFGRPIAAERSSSLKKKHAVSLI